MCVHFSAIVTNDSRIHFSTSQSHSAILKALGISDSFFRNYGFVRLECEPPFTYVYVDQSNQPSWFDDIFDNIWKRLTQLAMDTNPYFQAFFTAQIEMSHKYDDKRTAVNIECGKALDIINEKYDALEKFASDNRDLVLKSVPHNTIIIDDHTKQWYTTIYNLYDNVFSNLETQKQIDKDTIYNKRSAAQDDIDHEYSDSLLPAFIELETNLKKFDGFVFTPANETI